MIGRRCHETSANVEDTNEKPRASAIRVGHEALACPDGGAILPWEGSSTGTTDTHSPCLTPLHLLPICRQHGRLGTGDLRCRSSPVRLKSWPPGFLSCTVRDVALGGAHSVLLAHRNVPITLANPWGTESLAYAWGYGYCGQLGIGERVSVG